MTTTATRERPILFSSDMIRALLAGRKTQTRRPVKPQPYNVPFRCLSTGTVDDSWIWKDKQDNFPKVGDCPFGAPGDVLWVRETWAPSVKAPKCQVSYAADGRCYAIGGNGAGGYVRNFIGWRIDSKVRGDADGNTLGVSYFEKWRPSILMPRWASRLTLRITEVRVQRLHDIGKDGRKAKEVLAEGVTEVQIEHERKWFHPDDAPALAYSRLWEQQYGTQAGLSWADNPWVWCITFEVLP